MKAIICNEWCKPEDLKIEDVENPTLDENSVRIEVFAAGVNFPDVLIIQGKYQYKPNFPFSPGSEVAGIVIETGENVRDVKVGDRVMSVTGHGAFAEQICIESSKVTILPESMDYVTAAGVSLTYGTSAYALFQRALIKKNDFVLIHGATGGVGLAAIEISKAVGAKVIATASTGEKLRVAKEYGADYCINYTNCEFKEKVKEITNKKGADIIYDPVGGEVFEKSLRCIAWDGRLLVIGFASGKIANAPTNLPLLKNCSIVGVFWGAWRERNPLGHNQNMEIILKWWKEKKINPLVSKTFSLEDTKDALYALMNREIIGKAVIKIK
ncbi:MAG: NADPH:quinone oxidoreductase family protein [Pseudomonadota bacterium]|nr:NADPH:quinone oxidoreductase family protein [Pseudomonadota bacterium]